MALLQNLVSSSDVHHGSLKRKRHISNSLPENVPIHNVTVRALEKRFDDARFTFFATGLGACGKTNSPSDFVCSTFTLSQKLHTNGIVDCGTKYGCRF